MERELSIVDAGLLIVLVQPGLSLSVRVVILSEALAKSKDPLHYRSTRGLKRGFISGTSLQPPHNLLKHLPALLIILELIKAGASRSQQHHITRLGHSIRLAQRILQRLGVHNFDVLNLRFDLPGRRADRIHPLHALRAAGR